MLGKGLSGGVLGQPAAGGQQQLGAGAAGVGGLQAPITNFADTQTLNFFQTFGGASPWGSSSELIYPSKLRTGQEIDEMCERIANTAITRFERHKRVKNPFLSNHDEVIGFAEYVPHSARRRHKKEVLYLTSFTGAEEEDRRRKQEAYENFIEQREQERVRWGHRRAGRREDSVEDRFTSATKRSNLSFSLRRPGLKDSQGAKEAPAGEDVQEESREAAAQENERLASQAKNTIRVNGVFIHNYVTYGYVVQIHERRRIA